MGFDTTPSDSQVKVTELLFDFIFHLLQVVDVRLYVDEFRIGSSGFSTYVHTTSLFNCLCARIAHDDK